MLFNPHLRAKRMTVGVAMVVMQMAEYPIILGCAEVIANRLSKCTAGGPAVAIKSFTEDSIPQYALTEYGLEVKRHLEKHICLNVN